MSHARDYQSRKVINEILQEFLVPGNISSMLHTALNEAEQSKVKGYDCYLTLIANLVGITETLSIPFNLVAERVSHSNMQRFHIAERIRAQKFDEEAREAIAYEAAKLKFNDWISGDGKEILKDEILYRLDMQTRRKEALRGTRELIRQGVVMAWSAFEVFCRDSMECALNNDKKILKNIITNAEIRKKYISDHMAWNVILEYEYNLSGRMGSYISTKIDMSSILTIKKIYKIMFPKSKNISEAIGDRRLWILNHRRNLIVHRRAVVDQRYIEMTGEKYNVGDMLKLIPGDVEEFQEAIFLAGASIAEEMLKLGDLEH